MGDAGAWSKRIAEGQKKLVADAMKGIRGMPAKGGNPDLSDLEFERAAYLRDELKKLKQRLFIDAAA